MILTFIDIDIWDILDIVLVAVIIYLLYNLLKGTVAIKIFVGILFIYLIWRLVTALQMEMLGEILGQGTALQVTRLLIVFQKELRQFLLFLGNQDILKGRKRLGFLAKLFGDDQTDKAYLSEILATCQSLSKTQTGALMVIAQTSDPLNFVSSGHKIDAVVSAQLLESIFHKDSPLHDGAVVIKDGRIAISCGILPTSEADLESSLGTRHRAALGISELTDALTVIVSEQTGEISVTKEGVLHRNLSPAALKSIISNPTESHGEQGTV